MQLSYSKEFDRYVLNDSTINSYSAETGYGESYEMVIEQHIFNEYSYRFLVWQDGEWWEMLTHAQYRERLEDIEAHESAEIAELWDQHQNSYMIFNENHKIFGLRRKWEAMQELKLFDIPVTWSPWQSKPMSAEGNKLMNAAREKWQQEEAEG